MGVRQDYETSEAVLGGFSFDVDEEANKVELDFEAGGRSQDGRRTLFEHGPKEVEFSSGGKKQELGKSGNKPR